MKEEHKRSIRRIVVFGSSTVVGKMDSEYGGFVALLQRWFEGWDKKNIIYNLGLYGEKLSEMPSRFEREVPLRKPHLIILYPGFNEIQRVGSKASPCASTTEEMKSKIEELLRMSVACAPTVVLTGFPFDESRTTPYENSQAHYLHEDAVRVGEIIQQAAKEQGAEVIDLFSLWPKGEDLLDRDGLHANTKGHEFLFSKVREFVEKLL